MIGVIADDLSGAAEIGAIGLRYGLRARIACGAGEGEDWNLDVMQFRPDGRRDSDELICVDTDSRLCSNPEARRRTALAARLLANSKAKWIYKKIDSVLRGHVDAEAKSIMSELGLQRAIVIPANPSRGRVVKRGSYWIADRLIHETEFARDPEYPRTAAGVLELVGAVGSNSVRVGKPSAELPRSGIVIGEASTPRDLQRWARLHKRKLLMAGAAEFFTALLKERGFEESPVRGDLPRRPGRELFVCGTMSESAALFVKQSRAARVPVFSLPSELAWGAEFTAGATESVARRVANSVRHHARVILTIGLPPARNPAVGRSLTSHLVSVAVDVIRRGTVERVYAEGGATAAALVLRMGWTQMDVIEEVTPGVATLGVRDGSGVRLTIKPGSYLWPRELLKG